MWPVGGTQVADRTGYQSGSQPKEACLHGHRKAPDAAVVVDVTSVSRADVRWGEAADCLKVWNVASLCYFAEQIRQSPELTMKPLLVD